jgi:hypothetical protein
MQAYEYTTGRVYDGKQTLVISHRDIGIDEDLLDTVEVVFEDSSRHIKGSVTLMVCYMTTQREVGNTVLSLYDAGAYKLI